MSGARQHHRVRPDAALHAHRALGRGGGPSALPAVGVPCRGQGSRGGVRSHPPRGHAEKRRALHADARGALRGARLSRLREEARRAVREKPMNDTPKAKKSVALSGVTAGNTALCSVGRTGNDLHYRGYDILEIAHQSEFEEIAFLLVHGKLPTSAELSGYKARLQALRGLPAAVRTVLEALPAAAHPMDVLRSGVSALGCILPEKDDHLAAGAREIADRLIASLGSMLTYWYHFSHSGERIHTETGDDSIGAHFLHLLHRRPPPAGRGGGGATPPHLFPAAALY